MKNFKKYPSSNINLTTLCKEIKKGLKWPETIQKPTEPLERNQVITEITWNQSYLFFVYFFPKHSPNIFPSDILQNTVWELCHSFKKSLKISKRELALGMKFSQSFLLIFSFFPFFVFAIVKSIFLKCGKIEKNSGGLSSFLGGSGPSQLFWCCSMI